MRFVVATHGHCFDGLASAVIFSRLVRKVEGKGVELTYRAAGYGQGQKGVTSEILSGDQNAILDYRFLASERVTWYFDHHRTAFPLPGDRSYFDGRTPEGRFHYDAACTSCTKLVADVAGRQFGVGTDDLGDLIRWADVIDSAAFRTPADALDRTNPILRLAAVVERHGDDRLLEDLVPRLERERLEAVAGMKAVEQRYEKLAAPHDRFVQRVKERAVRRGQVVLVDLTDEPLETIGKFVTYALHPEAVYSVMVGLLQRGVKISVGYNPWSGRPCGVDISAICARHGGGGHPVVGAIQLPLDRLADARDIALEITRELETS